MRSTEQNTLSNDYFENIVKSLSCTEIQAIHHLPSGMNFEVGKFKLCTLSNRGGGGITRDFEFSPFL